MYVLIPEIDKMLLMYDDLMGINAVPDVWNLGIGGPAVGNDVRSRQTRALSPQTPSALLAIDPGDIFCWSILYSRFLP